jgi:hypothetical protein
MDGNSFFNGDSDSGSSENFASKAFTASSAPCDLQIEHTTQKEVNPSPSVKKFIFTISIC